MDSASNESGGQQHRLKIRTSIRLSGGMLPIPIIMPVTGQGHRAEGQLDQRTLYRPVGRGAARDQGRYEDAGIAEGVFRRVKE